MMKRFLIALLALVLLSPAARAEGEATPAPAPAPASSGASANHLPAAVIAVVDIEKIMHDALAAKSVRDQLATRRDEYQKEVTADEQKLREAEQQLAQQRASLTEEQFTQKRREFEQKVQAAQQGVQERRRVLDTAFNQALATIHENLGQIVAEAAKERGATVVLDKAQVVVVESSLDMTAVVLERLNRKLPRVQVTLPAAGAARR